MSLESVVYRLVAEPANSNCDSDCDRPLESPAITYGDLVPLGEPGFEAPQPFNKSSSIERSGRLRFGQPLIFSPRARSVGPGQPKRTLEPGDIRFTGIPQAMTEPA